MKKRMLAVALSASMVVSMGVVTLPVHAEEGEPYKAALLLNGTLGDKSFFDSANSGLEALKEEDLEFLAQSAYADASCPGNPKETCVEDLKELFRKLM